eukprot:6828498-Heterocapsa_arctica.AAC.1
MILKEECSVTDGEWEKHQKMRQLGIKACPEALAILSGNDAHVLFIKTFNFVHSKSKMQSDCRNHASAVIAATAKMFINPRLSLLAYKVKLDALMRMKKTIDDMIAELMKQKEDEIEI